MGTGTDCKHALFVLSVFSLIVRQATLKKKMMKEGLLDEKGKPNERTPSDWHSKYKEFTHYGKSPNGTGAAEGPAGDQQASEPAAEQAETGAEKKKKKKKRKDEADD